MNKLAPIKNCSGECNVALNGCRGITNKSQEISFFPAGDHKAAMDRRESMRNTRHKTQIIGIVIT